MHTTRLAASIAALSAASLSLVACSGGGGTGDPNTLTIEDYYSPAYDAIYEACAKEVGVDVDIVHVAGAGLVAKVLQQVSSKTLPDVLMLDNPDVQQIAETGALAPLEDFGLDGEGNVDGVTAAGTYEGVLYGIVPATNSIALFYNEDLLAAAGVAPPKTWDELRAAAAALTSGSTYGFAMSNVNTGEGTWQFLPFFWSAGGDEADIATPEAEAALQLIADLQADGSMSQSSVSWSQADVNSQFIAGNAAMMINGPWQIPTLEETEGLNFASVPIPVPAESDTLVSPLGGEAFTVPNTGDEKKMAQAGEFVGCLNTPAMQQKISELTGTVPTSVAAGAEFADAHPEYASFVETVQTARSRTTELGPEWPAAAERIYTAVQLALTGKATPAEALEQAQAQ